MKASVAYVFGSLVAIAADGCGRRDAPGEAQNVSVTPPWLEPAIAEEFDRDIQGGEIVAVGHRHALAGSPPNVAVEHVDAGLVGFLRLPPDVVWVGLSADDSVMAATNAGRLFVAPSVIDGVRGAFEQRSQLYGALAWDASDVVVAAASADVVYISIDGGRSFVARLRVSESLVSVFVVGRHVLAISKSSSDAWTDATVHLSLDAGVHWRNVGAPRGRVRRMATWITEAAEVRDIGSSTEQCPRAVTNGGTWGRVDVAALAGLRERWAAWPRGVSSDVAWYRSSTRPLTIDDAMPDAADGPLVGRDCVVKQYGLVRPDHLGVLASEEPGASPAEALSLPDVQPLTTRTSFEIADDGVCTTVSDEVCTGTVVRPPHVVILDRVEGSVTVSSLPPQCSVTRMFSLRGLGLLLCTVRGQVHAYSYNRAGAWEFETALPPIFGARSTAEVGDDGTVLVVSNCEGEDDCGAAVRRLDSPHAEAWWFARLGSMDAYRLAAYGAILGIATVPLSQRHVWAQVWLLDSNRIPRPLVGATVLGPLRAVSLRGGVLRVDGRPL